MAGGRAATGQRLAVGDEERRLTVLLKRVATGDADAFAQLYDALAPTVFGLTAGVLRSPELAEEVTQDVFLWLWQSAPRFDPARGSVLALVCTVARRRAIDAVRREAAVRRRAELLQRQPDGRPTSVPDSCALVTDREELRGLLAGLTAVQREAVELSFWHGLSGEELAGRLGIKLATAKTRKRDGIVRMRWAAHQAGLA